MRRRIRWELVTRDLVVFVSGLLGIVHETVIHTGPERPTLIVLFGACLGLPAFLRLDERRRRT